MSEQQTPARDDDPEGRMGLRADDDVDDTEGHIVARDTDRLRVGVSDVRPDELADDAEGRSEGPELRA